MHLDLSYLPKRSRGSALILVLWCLLLLGMAVFGVVDMVLISTDQTTHASLAFEAKALASSGVALGLNPQLTKDDPILSQKVSAGHQFTVNISSEGARLNLNFVLLSGHREILSNLFNQWGLSIEDSEHAADCLYDWITPGEMKSLNGAKADDYAQAGLPQRPTGRPFVSLDEVREVMGMDAVQKARPQWEDSFTLWSGGPLNIQEAPADLIAAVFGISTSQASSLTKIRNGEDGVAGTSDDVPLVDLQQIQSELGIPDLVIKSLASEISFSDPNRRVESIGQVDDVQATISVVTRLKSSPIQYFLWSEK